MAAERPPRDRQRGNSLVLALIVMSALATLGSLTVVSVQSSLKASTNDRSQTVALYAAESGAVFAMDFLRHNAVDWNPYITTVNTVGIIPVAPDPLFPTNRAQPAALGNPFSVDQNAWFDIQFFNNRDEPIDPLIDVDRQIIIRSTGHGPQESVAVV
jgi:Tfp pilus assembly protein PilX